MSRCDDVRHDLGGYVLGALEPGEAAAVHDHLGTCAACAAEHAPLAGLPALLALADGLEDAPGERPPRAVEERVLDAVARERARPRTAGRRRRRRLPRPRILIAAAGVAAATVIALVLAAGGDPPLSYGFALAPTGVSAGTARAELESVAGGTAVRLWVRDLPADSSVVYEVRCEAPGWSASAGTFRVDSRGRAYVVLTTAARRGEYDAIRIVRRARDSGGRMTTADVFTADLS